MHWPVKGRCGHLEEMKNLPPGNVRPSVSAIINTPYERGVGRSKSCLSSIKWSYIPTCRKKKSAYCESLGSFKRSPSPAKIPLLEESVLAQIGEKHGKSAQVVLGGTCNKASCPCPNHQRRSATGKLPGV